MTNELSKKQLCLYIRNGIEIWLDEDKAQDYMKYLLDEPSKFNRIEGRIINTADVVGLFSPEDLDDLKRRKMGQWKCDKGYWHSKNEDCSGHRVKEYDPRGWIKA